MSAAGKSIIEGAKEALAVARGEQPAASMTIKGHTYLPKVSVDATIAALQSEIARLKEALTKIAYEDEIHTKLSQERLCCKFQDIALAALSAPDVTRRGE